MAESVTGSTKKAVRATAEAAGKQADRGVSLEERQSMIAEAAYYRAEQRGFSSEGAEHDWLLAEQEVDELLANRIPGRRLQSRH